jgi:hypothetical protein
MKSRERAPLPKAVLEHVTLVHLRALVGDGRVAEVFVEESFASVDTPNWKIAGIRDVRGRFMNRKGVPPDVLLGIHSAQQKLSQHYSLSSD